MKVTTNSSSSAFLSGRRFPPGFRFHPTDEELILYYLKRKICHKRLLIDAICETDVYKWHPEELPDLSKLKTGDRQWFFFSPRDRKYPNGGRSNRATKHGYWKATGKDRTITCNSRAVGVKKTLVFYNGRAPTGIRTDWVMHEYTLDEEEFRRCKSAQDYYVLYKLFKKSGAGPKNGEQYGAPFNEEEWEKDDDCEYFDPNCPVDLEKSMKLVDDVALALIESPKPVNPQFQCPRDNFEGFLNPIGNEPPLAQPLAADDSENALLDHSSRELTLPVPDSLNHTASQQCNVKANFELTQSGTSQPVLQEAPEVTSSTGYHQQPQVVIEDFLEDFLEMDDLSAEINIHTFNEQVEKLDTQPFNGFDGFDEFDMYKGASTFLHDVGTMEGGHATTEPLVNNVMNGIVNPVSTYLSDFPEAVNNQQLYFGGGNQLWLHDQRSDIFTYPDPIQGTIPPVAIPPVTSGVNYDNDVMNQPVGAIQFQSARQDDASNSSFSSALWAFVESIPTNPASASETALVNKTIGRMTSLRRLRINAINMNVAAAGGKASRKPRSGLLCFSLLGLLCAILWLFAFGVVGG